jgi:hypothetical protein
MAAWVQEAAILQSWHTGLHASSSWSNKNKKKKEKEK